jgi:hypothetical protein
LQCQAVGALSTARHHLLMMAVWRDAPLHAMRSGVSAAAKFPGIETRTLCHAERDAIPLRSSRGETAARTLENVSMN